VNRDVVVEPVMDESAVARDLAAVIAAEIAAQLGVHRLVKDMPPLIADAILDAFQVQPREEVEFRFKV
jgi:hypothetical protein